ncbi:hypothetical protein H8Z72_23235 (plasmid) [Xanthomonas citri pv. citri]|uniref:hypothetical protein n=1 Tax=Xanthomonas citri TaxID=346 RepID=UPI001934224A|nr:hypothetical protein [Xanthomonas citri]QRD62771.1 hypothetical protein H8Z74_22950 [Xanthomonas citri pv. citri]QRD67098.1 hypothetical protein H8Z73_23035 [Xanthomonas citri pv. citri]QRD71649.1 hypothetical protein H8Z72_23235 [Xanthomonas citri pv. citri]
MSDQKSDPMAAEVGRYFADTEMLAVALAMGASASSATPRAYLQQFLQKVAEAGVHAGVVPPSFTPADVDAMHRQYRARMAAVAKAASELLPEDSTPSG